MSAGEILEELETELEDRQRPTISESIAEMLETAEDRRLEILEMLTSAGE